jgi:signal transduction histidine kinase
MLDMNAELESKVAERTLILQEALQELERSQLDLNEALSKEKELNEIKSRFVSMASHEFRTPLSTVLSSASLISKYRVSEDQPKREKHISRIKDSVKHLNHLLEDFLSLGKLEEGRVSTHSGEFNVKEFLVDVLDEMRGGLKPAKGCCLTLKARRFLLPTSAC